MYGPGCPSGLNIDNLVVSSSFRFPDSTAVAFLNSSSSMSLICPSRSPRSISPSLKGTVRLQVPPLNHSPFSKWSGVVVLKNSIVFCLAANSRARDIALRYA
ncbi:hypothetical protein LINGRAHAP2_LOCUS335 [Linum grandiflorum]